MALSPGLIARYRKVRRWVDRDLSGGRRYTIVAGRLVDTGDAFRPGASVLGMIAPIFVGITYDRQAHHNLSHWGLAWGLAVAALWLIFVAWRLVRVMRARDLKWDRIIQRSGRNDLPPEYRDAESAAMAAWKRRKGNANRNG